MFFFYFFVIFYIDVTLESVCEIFTFKGIFYPTYPFASSRLLHLSNALGQRVTLTRQRKVRNTAPDVL